MVGGEEGTKVPSSSLPLPSIAPPCEPFAVGLIAVIWRNEAGRRRADLPRFGVSRFNIRGRSNAATRLAIANQRRERARVSAYACRGLA
jgi:hypothetical protein